MLPGRFGFVVYVVLSLSIVAAIAISTGSESGRYLDSNAAKLDLSFGVERSNDGADVDLFERRYRYLVETDDGETEEETEEVGEVEVEEEGESEGTEEEVEEVEEGSDEEVGEGEVEEEGESEGTEEEEGEVEEEEGSESESTEEEEVEEEEGGTEEEAEEEEGEEIEDGNAEEEVEIEESILEWFVNAQVTLGSVTAETFDELTFRASCASTLNVDVARVEVVGIVPSASRRLRQLHSQGVTVDFRVRVDNNEAGDAMVAVILMDASFVSSLATELTTLSGVLVEAASISAVSAVSASVEPEEEAEAEGEFQASEEALDAHTSSWEISYLMLAIAHTALLVCSLGAGVKVASTERSSLRSAGLTASLLTADYALFRLLYFYVDPYGVKEVYGRVVETMIFGLAFPLLLGSTMYTIEAVVIDNGAVGQLGGVVGVLKRLLVCYLLTQPVLDGWRGDEDPTDTLFDVLTKICQIWFIVYALLQAMLAAKLVGFVMTNSPKPKYWLDVPFLALHLLVLAGFMVYAVDSFPTSIAPWYTFTTVVRWLEFSTAVVGLMTTYLACGTAVGSTTVVPVQDKKLEQ